MLRVGELAWRVGCVQVIPRDERSGVSRRYKYMWLDAIERVRAFTAAQEDKLPVFEVNRKDPRLKAPERGPCDPSSYQDHRSKGQSPRRPFI